MRHVLAYWWVVLAISLASAIFIPFTQPIVDLTITRAFSDLRGIDYALALFQRDHGRYPTEEEGLAALVPDVLRKVPKDPWGSVYAYRQDDHSTYAVYSIGVNRLDERGDGDDVTTSSKTYRCEDYGVNCPPDATELAAYVAAALAVISLSVGLGRGATWLYRRRASGA